MTTTVEAALADVVTERGWRSGTALENRVARFLGWRHNGVEQQYRVGRYRLDFAWPAVKMAIEADGWHHRTTEHALRDANRDAWLRSQGWVIFRVDDTTGEDSLLDQVARAVRLVNQEIRSR